MTALFTLQLPPLGNLVAPVLATSRANKTVRPSDLKKMHAADIIRLKPGFELFERQSRHVYLQLPQKEK
jgi:hypothetical protein